VAKVRACIASARSEEGVPISAAELDRDPWVLCCPNGTVDLKTAKLRPSRKTDLLTKVAGAEYDRNAYASRWYTFLERVLPDADVRGYVQRAAGYALCGKCAEKALFFLYGATGDNGKTVFLSALLDVFGEYGLRAPAELLLANDHGSGNTLDKAMLCGARLVVTVEVEDGRRMAESVVREITGADRITARRLYEMPFEFDPTHTIFLAANHRPVIKCQDPAIWNRIKTIPFLEQIPKAEQDPLLTDKLREERAGILNWLLVGYQDWQEGGLREPAGVVAANEEYKLSVDVLADFLAERCVFDPGYATAGPELWIEYSTWCKNNEVRGIGKQALGARIREHAGVSAAVGIGPKASRGFRGIGIKNSVQQASL
jgi:putative DNA primase/helicase